jgi:Carboxypeptidase regulatory-like domain
MRTTTKKMRKRKKRRSGTSEAQQLILSRTRILAALLLLTFAFPHLHADSKPAGQKGARPYAVVAGTVFREPGFALAGAVVAVRAEPPDGETLPKEFKPQKTVSDGRGEFAFHVPPLPMRYVVSVSAKGFRPDHKSAEIRGEERVDVTFQLQEESK